MKTFKIKNYKGNLVESLSKFQESHKDMKIVEAVEEGDTLKITVNEGISYISDGLLKSPTVNTLIDWLIKFKKQHPDLVDKKIYCVGPDPWVFDDDFNEIYLNVQFGRYES